MQRLIAACLLVLAFASPSTQAASTRPAPPPALASAHAMVVDDATGEVILAKNHQTLTSIASVTKLMTAMVVLDAKLPMDEVIEIGWEDVDQLKKTASRMRVGTQATRHEMLLLALMSSENRAASSLSRHYPGGRSAFIKAMQRKARSLGMKSTRFMDATGLTPANVSTAEDLVKMVRAAERYPLIHQFSTTPGRDISFARPRYTLSFHNTNALVRGGEWPILVSKTGYIEEAGRCLVMMTKVGNRQVAMVLLDSQGKLSPVGDATRIRQWMQAGPIAKSAPIVTKAAAKSSRKVYKKPVKPRKKPVKKPRKSTKPAKKPAKPAR